MVERLFNSKPAPLIFNPTSLFRQKESNTVQNVWVRVKLARVVYVLLMIDHFLQALIHWLACKAPSLLSSPSVALGILRLEMHTKAHFHNLGRVLT
eukprot:4336845-Amphidinium_carterae.1